MLDILSYPETTIRYTIYRPAKNFQNGGSRMAGNAILRLVFANTVFHKTAMLQLFYAEYTESVLDTPSYPESTLGPP